MRVESGGNCHGDSAARRSMTTGAASWARAGVTRMIEFHVEAAEPRKLLYGPGLRIRMADRAYGVRCIGKLLHMTTSTRQVFVTAG